MELSEKLRIKTQQGLNRKEFTEKVYLGIREDCLRYALDYFIEDECKSRFTQGDMSIVRLICDKFKYKTDGSYIDCDSGLGGSAHATYPMFYGSVGWDDEKSKIRYSEAKRLLLDIDYQLLRSKLRDYFESYGLVGGYTSERFGRSKTLTFSCSDATLRKAIDKFESPKPPPLPKLPEGTPEEFDEVFFERSDSQGYEGKSPATHASCWVMAIIVLVVALGFIFFR